MSANTAASIVSAVYGISTRLPYYKYPLHLHKVSALLLCLLHLKVSPVHIVSDESAVYAVSSGYLPYLLHIV
jgi:hypothetical protein